VDDMLAPMTMIASEREPRDAQEHGLPPQPPQFLVTDWLPVRLRLQPLDEPRACHEGVDANDGKHHDQHQHLDDEDDPVADARELRSSGWSSSRATLRSGRCPR
jgi:hypothetical protein